MRRWRLWNAEEGVECATLSQHQHEKACCPSQLIRVVVYRSRCCANNQSWVSLALVSTSIAPPVVACPFTARSVNSSLAAPPPTPSDLPPSAPSSSFFLVAHLNFAGSPPLTEATLLTSVSALFAAVVETSRCPALPCSALFRLTAASRPLFCTPFLVFDFTHQFRALRLDHGNFSWSSESRTKSTRILEVCYNASNNELVSCPCPCCTAFRHLRFRLDFISLKKFPGAHQDSGQGRHCAD